MSAKSNMALVAIGAVLGAVIGASISYAIMQPALSGLQSTVDSMAASRIGLENRVDALNSSGLALAQRVNSVSTIQDILGDRIDALNSNGLALAQRVDSVTMIQDSLEGRIDALNSSQLELKEDFAAMNNSLAYVEMNLTEHLNQTLYLALSSPTLSSSDGIVRTKPFEAKGPVRLLWSFEADVASCWLMIQICYASNDTIAATRMISGRYDMDTSDLELPPAEYYLILKPSLSVIEYYVKVYQWY